MVSKGLSGLDVGEEEEKVCDGVFELRELHDLSSFFGKKKLLLGGTNNEVFVDCVLFRDREEESVGDALGDLSVNFVVIAVCLVVIWSMKALLSSARLLI